MAGTDDNNASDRQSGAQRGRWFWIAGLIVGILAGTAFAMGFTSVAASTQQVE